MDRLPPFLRFAIIGALGFLLDLAVLAFAIEVLGLGPYAGRALSFAVTVTFTWAMNRWLRCSWSSRAIAPRTSMALLRPNIVT